MASWLQKLLPWLSSQKQLDHDNTETESKQMIAGTGSASESPLPPANTEKRIGSSETTVTTVMNSSLKTFNWRILDFDKICPLGCINFVQIKSPVFTAGKDVGMKSEWLLHIVGKEKEINCFLKLISVNGKNCLNHRNVTCSLKISFGNNENPHIFTKNLKGTTLFTRQSPTWGFLKFISIPKLHEMKLSLLRNNALHICVELQIFGDSKEVITSLPIKRLKGSIITGETFSSDFRQLLDNKKDADVEIVCGNQTFNAHKIVLSARSKVFKAMFESEMKETFTNQIILSDMDPDTVYAVLQYIYTGKVVFTESTSIYELLYGAEKYDLPELKKICFNKMLKFVSETIGTLAVAVDIYNADEEAKRTVKMYCQRKCISDSSAVTYTPT